jgi:outer membrane protein TolC
MNRLSSIIALGAVAFTGCQGPGIASRGTATPRGQVAVERQPFLNAGNKISPSTKSADGPTADGKIRLVAGDDEGDLQTSAPIPVVPDLSALSLDAAIERALVGNPDMIAVRQAEGVSAAAYGVAATYPFNPFIQTRVLPYQEGKEPNINTTFHYLLLMQTIQLGHQQQFREEVAASQLNQVRWNIHNFELLNAAQTTRLYFAAVYQKGIRDLTRSNAELNQQLLRISAQQADAGQITKADLAIVGLDARSTRQQADLAEANYQTALLDLRRQLNLPLETTIELTDELTALRWKPVHEAARTQLGESGVATEIKLDLGSDRELIKRMADGRPDLMAARADVDTSHASYRLANASRIPDLQFGPFYQVDEFGTTFFGFQGQMDVPVINTGKPLARQRAVRGRPRHPCCGRPGSRSSPQASSSLPCWLGG